jgi:hypothetical protein
MIRLRQERTEDEEADEVDERRQSKLDPYPSAHGGILNCDGFIFDLNAADV